MRRLREMRAGMSSQRHRDSGGKGMKKHWYDYLWIASLLYLLLGFFNILFAWLGLLCFFIPLILSVTTGTKVYCNRYCGRGQLFALIGGRFGLSRKKDIPSWMKSKAFRYGFLIFFFAMFFSFSRMILRLYAVPRKYCFIVHPNRSHMPALATSDPYKIATEPSSSPSAL